MRIFGEEYPLLVENRLLTELAAQYVDAQMHEYRRKGIDLSTAKIAILTAVNFAEKVIELESRLDHLTSKITSLSHHISEHYAGKNQSLSSESGLQP